MPEFSFLLKELIEHQLLIKVEAADADAAHEAAWAQLKASGSLGTLPPTVQSSRKVLSQSVLPAAAATQQEAERQSQAHPPVQSMANYGRLLLTHAVNAWIHSTPAEQIPREMHLRQCLNRHLNGEDGDIHPDDAHLNAHARHAPQDGGRLMSVWTSAEHPVLWIITDAYASPEAVTTVLFPDDY
jgi:hypothetical protein